jgi:5'-3' exonuclease
MKPEVLLIDLSSLFWSAWHATEKDIGSDAVAITMSAVRRCHQDAPDLEYTAICLDQGRSFRKDMAPTYKAQRPEKDHAALNQLADVKRKLADAGYLLWGADGFEADDVIATAATQASAAGHPVRICTSDKDLLQLLALPESSVVRTYNTWDTWRSANVVEKFGVDPEGLGDWLALCGDKSDGIEGCKSVGPVTAKTLLTTHYSIDGIYSRIDDLPKSPAGVIATKTPEAAKIATPAVLQNLIDCRAQVYLARKLVTLRTDAPIDFNQIYEKREPKAAQEIADMDDAKFEDERISVPSAPATEMAGGVPLALGSHPTVGAGATNTEAARGGEAATISKGIPSPEPKPSAGRDASAADTEAARGGEAAAILKEDQRQKKDVTSQPANGASLLTPAPAPTTIGTSETALVPTQVTAVSFQQALEPMSLGQTFKLAAELYKAGLYAKFATPQAIAAVIMRGRELGLGALSSLDAFHVVEGRPYPWAYLLISLAKADKDCEWFTLISSSDVEATWECKSRRRAEPQRYTYTIQEAEKAGLLVVKPGKQPGPWLTRPRDQLTKTAGAKLQRVEFPGSGLGISVEEVDNG